MEKIEIVTGVNFVGESSCLPKPNEDQSMVTVIGEDGTVVTVPAYMATTPSQLRWLSQPRFTGGDSMMLPVDIFDTYVHYRNPVIYRTTKQVIKDFLGTLYLNRGWFARLVYRFTTIEQRRTISLWGEIVAALKGKKLKWKVL